MRPEKTHKNSDSGIRFKTSADDAISHMVLSCCSLLQKTECAKLRLYNIILSSEKSRDEK